MKAFHLLAPVVLGLLALGNSCHRTEDDAPCPNVLVAPVPLPAWRTANAYCLGAPGSQAPQQNFVLNSAAELRAVYPCDSLPAIDFSRYTLLLGKTQTSSCSVVQSQQIQQNCQAYTYRVQLAAGTCLAVSEVIYYQLLPKLPAGATVSFEVRRP